MRKLTSAPSRTFTTTDSEEVLLLPPLAVLFVVEVTCRRTGLTTVVLIGRATIRPRAEVVAKRIGSGRVVRYLSELARCRLWSDVLM